MKWNFTDELILSVYTEQKKKRYKFLICFPMNYRDFSVKINGKNNSEITIFIFTVCKKRSFYEFSAESLAQKV